MDVLIFTEPVSARLVTDRFHDQPIPQPPGADGLSSHSRNELDSFGGEVGGFSAEPWWQSVRQRAGRDQGPPNSVRAGKISHVCRGSNPATQGTGEPVQPCQNGCHILAVGQARETSSREVLCTPKAGLVHQDWHQ